MHAKIVLVRSVYGENIGLAARAMKNFSFKELALVRPECDWKTAKARSRAMHGKEILRKAKSFDSIGEATKDCAYAVATSARKGAGRNALSALEFAERFGKSSAKTALVFGPEPSGLTNQEIGECDFIVSIPASKKYGTLNLSHAVCIMLFLLSRPGKQGRSFKEAAPSEKRLLERLFSENLGMLSGIDDRKTVLASFRALLGRSLLSEKEAKALAAFLSESGKEMRKRRKE